MFLCTNNTILIFVIAISLCEEVRFVPLHDFAGEAVMLQCVPEWAR